MAASSAAGLQGPFNSNGNGLIVYVYPGCYYSQKVLLALHEKRLKYKPHIVNLFAGDHLKPWFLKLNPNGRLPVLQDGIKVIPNSESIIEYLEDNFYNGNFPKLQPSKGTESFQKVKVFVELLNQVNIEVLSFGTVYSPELSSEPKMSESERRGRLSFQHIEQVIVDLQKQYPENHDLLERKKEECRLENSLYQDTDSVHKEITSTSHILDQIESELASHKNGEEHWWLCCDTFTIADVSLASLLNHLDGLGLASDLLHPSKRPYLKNYKERLCQRATYKMFVLELKQLQALLEPSFFTQPLLFALGSVTVFGLVTVLSILYKRVRKV